MLKGNGFKRYFGTRSRMETNETWYCRLVYRSAKKKHKKTSEILSLVYIN